MNKTAFEEDQTSAISPDGIQNHYWQNARAKIIYAQLQKHSFLQDKILEVGCGRGQVVEALSSAGVDITGVEVADVKPFESIKDKVYAKKHTSEVPLEERQKVTVILLLDVIEHIENPEEFIKNIYSNYPHVKNLLITVPAMKNIWSNYDEFMKHFRRYELADLPKLADGVNSKIISSGYFFHLLYPMAHLLLKIKTKRDLSIKAPQGGAILIHKIVARLFFWEYLLCPKNLPGSSIMCILERRDEF